MKTEQTKNYNLSKLLEPYNDYRWVALSLDRKKIIASGKTLKEVAKKTVGDDVVFMKTLPCKNFYVPAIL